ncbi:MAG: radical SAM protein [Candidatus Pacebacteria bacterium]|nr:radical SAM protein [Candidatus Paceibacterota bacterium]
MFEKFLIKIRKMIFQNLFKMENQSIFSFGSLIPHNVFVISLTNRCNFNCPHCFRRYTDRKNINIIEDIPISLFETILKEGRLVNFKTVSLSGGEPILHPEFEDLMGLLTNYGYNFNITTNGWFSDQYYPILKKYKKNLELVFLSLDGATADVHDLVRGKPGSFLRVIEAIKIFKKNNIPIVVSAVFSKQNYHQFKDMVDICLKLGIRGIKCGAMLSPNESDVLTLNNREKIKLIREIVDIKNRLGGSFQIKANASLLEGGSFLEDLPGYKKIIDFCGILGHEVLYIDQKGGVMPCCDIYRECENRPTIQKNGFEECLKINMDIINEIKKQRLCDLLNESDEVYKTCSYCSKYFGKYLDKICKKKD